MRCLFYHAPESNSLGRPIMFTLGSIAAFRGIVITSFIKGASDANYIFLIFVIYISYLLSSQT